MKINKCDICGKELSYGVGETARGLIWGKVQPAGPGVNAHVVYKKESQNKDDFKDYKDFFLEDVCPACMAKLISCIEYIQDNQDVDYIHFCDGRKEAAYYKEESK